MYIEFDDAEILLRIKQVIKDLKSTGKLKSQANLARNIGISPQQLSEIIAGRNKLTPQFILKLCINTNTSYEYITKGHYPIYDVDDKNKLLEKIMFDNNLATDSKTESDNYPTQIIFDQGVPYWNLPVSAGRSLVDIIGAAKPDGYINGLPGSDIAENILPVTGTSMEPEINPGAIIGVRKMNNWDTLNTERIYLIITTDDRMIKRIEHDAEIDNILWCVSPNYPRFKIYKSDIIEIQRVCFVYNPK